MKRIIKETVSFIPKEGGSLPRVLLLDCNDSVFQSVKRAGYQVFQGKSGFVDRKREIPRDSSEIEIIFWDVSEMKSRYVAEYENEEYFIFTKNDKLGISGKNLPNFFSQVINKGGFVAVFFGNNTPYTPAISYSLGLLRYNQNGFSIEQRYTHQVNLIKDEEEEEDLFFLFFKRFVKDENIKFIIKWHSNVVDTKFYFMDEDGNEYAIVAWNEILISPYIENLDEAILFLLQDVLPYICDENIYPDLYKYKWLEDEFFKFPEIKKAEEEIVTLKRDYQKNIQDKELELQNEKKEISYLYEMLYKDDSDLFPEDEKLKDIIKKVLEKDIGFQDVTDIDKERKKEGLALKEDLRIGDNIFIEVKGTERGAKVNWVKDLAKHIQQYCIVTKTDLLNLKQILIFNHERRRDPQERSEPFANDPEFLKSCEAEKISLIPVFELFKIAIDLRNNKISQSDAQEKILGSTGLFVY